MSTWILLAGPFMKQHVFVFKENPKSPSSCKSLSSRLRHRYESCNFEPPSGLRTASAMVQSWKGWRLESAKSCLLTSGCWRAGMNACTSLWNHWAQQKSSTVITVLAYLCSRANREPIHIHVYIYIYIYIIPPTPTPKQWHMEWAPMGIGRFMYVLFVRQYFHLSGWHFFYV